MTEIVYIQRYTLIFWMGSCPIKWLVNMADINGPGEAVEHSFTDTTDFELHEQQELEAITIDSVDGVLICVWDTGCYSKSSSSILKSFNL